MLFHSIWRSSNRSAYSTDQTLADVRHQTPANIEADLFHFEGVEDLDSYYDIENVTIDRHTLTIRLNDKAEGMTSDYSIGIHKYAFLRTLLPSDIISIIHPLKTGNLTFRWALRGHMIPMKEFAKRIIEH